MPTDAKEFARNIKPVKLGLRELVRNFAPVGRNLPLFLISLHVWKARLPVIEEP